MAYILRFCRVNSWNGVDRNVYKLSLRRMRNVINELRLDECHVAFFLRRTTRCKVGITRHYGLELRS